MIRRVEIPIASKIVNSLDVSRTRPIFHLPTMHMHHRNALQEKEIKEP